MSRSGRVVSLRAQPLSGRSFRAQVSHLFGAIYTPSQMSYDLDWLRLNGLIERIVGNHTYLPNVEGRRIALSAPKSTTGCYAHCSPHTTRQHQPSCITPGPPSIAMSTATSTACGWETPPETQDQRQRLEHMRNARPSQAGDAQLAPTTKPSGSRPGLSALTIGRDLGEWDSWDPAGSRTRRPTIPPCACAARARSGPSRR